MVAMDEEKAAVGRNSDNDDGVNDTREGALEEVRLESDAEVRALEKALVQKVDWCVIPLISLLYLFSFLDRGMSPSNRMPLSLAFSHPFSHDHELTNTQSTSAMHDCMAWRKIWV